MFCRQRPDFFTQSSQDANIKVIDLTNTNSGDETNSTVATSSDEKSESNFGTRKHYVWSPAHDFSDKPDSNKLFYTGKREKMSHTLSQLNDAAILALYGDNFETEPILQARIVIMVCVYLCPLACGFTTSLLSINRQPGSAKMPDWTDHLIFLGGLTGSVSALVFFLRLIGRIKTSAFVSVILFFSSVLILFSDTSTLWMKRLSEISTGFALGLQLPTQYLITAETATPKQRTVLSLLNYVSLALGSLLPHLLAKIVRIQGQCILNCVILVAHFVVVGIFHPETPRFLFTAKDRKADCVNSLQWLRGKRADIGMEYADMADTPNMIRRSEIRSLIEVFLQRQVNQPLITAATLMTLTSLSGLLSVTFLLRINFKVFDERENQDRNLLQNQEESTPLIQMGYVVAGISLLAPLLCCLLVQRVSRKLILLLSSSLMAATLIFIALIIHFQPDVHQAHGWTLQTGAVLYLLAHHCGMGSLSWVYLSELIPLNAVEIGTALAASCWWAFNLVFSVTFASLVMAVGVPGLCLIHAIVSGLAYGFVLLVVPDVRSSSLQDIERYYARLVEMDKILPSNHTILEDRLG